MCDISEKASVSDDYNNEMIWKNDNLLDTSRERNGDDNVMLRKKRDASKDKKKYDLEPKLWINESTNSLANYVSFDIKTGERISYVMFSSATVFLLFFSCNNHYVMLCYVMVVKKCMLCYNRLPPGLVVVDNLYVV